MNRKYVILFLLIFVLVSLACTININIPNAQSKTGPTVTENIHVPLIQGGQAMADVTLKFGAGDLSLQPGAVGELISGTVTYNVSDFKPQISVDSNNINIEQGNIKVGGIPYINQNIINEWKLFLGNSPMSLIISAGAYTGDYELGGLSIHRLQVTDGASKAKLNFSKPNQIEMVSFDYTTGASDVTLTGLADANLTEMTFHGGAGTYTLDFNGQLQRDMKVSIDAGVSTVTVIVPKGVATRLSNESKLISVTSSGGWEQQGDTYLLSGSGYTITIDAKLGAGTLKLETSE